MLEVTTLAVLALGLALRVAPVALARRGAGIDHWYWRTWVETYRREGEFPPSLPMYTLDEKQWYPPVFPLFLSALPDWLFNRFNTFIAIAIDMLRMLLLIGVAQWRTGDPGVTLMAGLLYATTPIQVSYNIQLNPRGLAALMLDGLLLILLVLLDPGGPWWLWPIIVLLGGLILLTHKMSTQLFWFVILGTALIYRNWPLLALIPLSMIVALVLSRGFYANVLRAHWDIVSFWNRNWRWIGADLLRESPIYGDGSYERSEKLHRGGFRGVLRQAATLFGFNPAAWIGCLLVYERLWIESPVLFFPTYLLVWLLLPCLLACLTTFLPRLKSLGAGYLYLYNASLITSLLLGTAFEQTLVPRLSKPFILAALLCNVAAVGTYYVHFYLNKRSRVHEGLERLIDTLRELPRGVVMSIPANWYEVIAYKSGQPVLWGGHGYGFRKLEPTFPRLLLPIPQLLKQYDVHYLVTMDGMLTAAAAAELPDATLVTQGEYHLYCFTALSEDTPITLGHVPSATFALKSS